MRDCTSMRSGTYPARSNIGRRTFLAAFLVLCFLLGMIVGSWYPQWSECLSDVAVQGASTESDKVSARPIPQSDERNTEQVTAALLMELGAQRRLQERREEELRSEVREAEVALHLLCARGHAVDAPACREQVAKRRAAEAALTRLRVAAAEVAQLEA